MKDLVLYFDAWEELMLSPQLQVVQGKDEIKKKKNHCRFVSSMFCITDNVALIAI